MERSEDKASRSSKPGQKASQMVALFALLMIPFGLAGWGISLVFMFVVEWFYPVLFEVFRNGQTPGKKMLGITVVNDDLTPVSFGSSLLRNLLRVVDFLPFLYLLGLITMVTNQRFQRLGDLAAGTLVISVSAAAKTTDINEVEPMPPPVALNRQEQIAIIDFLQRSGYLSDSRKQELAAILDGITHEGDQHRVQQLQRIGAWFLGIR